jgi:hypothetical protein
MSPIEGVPGPKPRFQTLAIKGGPEGFRVVPTLDGEIMHDVHRIEVTVDVKDVIRVKTYTFAEVDLRLDVESVEQGYIVRVREGSVDSANELMTWNEVVQGRGRTVVEALRDAADTLELTEAAERLA